MKQNRNQPADAAELRRRAEERLKRQRSEGGGQKTEVETARLLHELQVHQVELEMQNEELRQARAQMDALLAQYTDLYDFAPAGYLTLDRKGAIRQVNLTGARLLGIERSRLVKRRFGSFVAEGDRRAFSDFLQEVFASQARESCEVTLPQEGSQLLVVRIEGTRSADGRECRAMVLDLTDRKRAEMALRESEERFHTIANHTEDLECWFRPDGRLLWVNLAVERITGYSVAECLAMPTFPLPLFAEEDVARNSASFQEGVRGTRGNDWEFRFVRKDGAKRWGSVSWQPIFASDGTALGHRSSVRDITERKRAEEALRMSEARYRSLFDNMVEGFAYCRILLEDGRPQDFIYLEVNKAFQTLTGLKNVTGRKVSEVIPGIRELDPELLERYGRVALTGQPERFETYLAALNLWLSISVYCPEKEHFVAVFDVITERRQAEKRMRMFSQEIIAAREEERKQVSSILHHDVGSLAVGISAHLDAIEEDLSSGKLGEALKWTKRTRKLFDESVVRLKTLAVQLRPPELDVLGLRAALRQYFSHVTERGDARIHFRETLGRRRVSGDTATILFRIAQEALTNALTHGHAKQVDVHLSTSKKEIKLTIRNNGKRFDPSEHWARATSRMGLRVMREMAVSAGGAFTIDSGRGKKTTVHVSLPLQTVALGPGDVTVREETVARRITTRSAGRGSRPPKGKRA